MFVRVRACVYTETKNVRAIRGGRQAKRAMYQRCNAYSNHICGNVKLNDIMEQKITIT